MKDCDADKWLANQTRPMDSQAFHLNEHHISGLAFSSLLQCDAEVWFVSLFVCFGFNFRCTFHVLMFF